MDGDIGIDMENVNLYYDHYKDSFEQQKGYLAKRDRLTALLLVFAILLIGLLFDPSTFSDKINHLIGSQMNNLSFDLQFINSGLILVVFWCLLQYYMIVIQIEKMYKYIDECEKRLIQSMPCFPINREGAYYLKSYPWLKDFADFFFVLGFPLCFIVLGVVKIFNEWNWPTCLRFVDFVFLLLIIVLSLLYISHRKCHEEFFDKKKYPEMNYRQRLVYYFGIRTAE